MLKYWKYNFLSWNKGRQYLLCSSNQRHRRAWEVVCLHWAPAETQLKSRGTYVWGLHWRTYWPWGRSNAHSPANIFHLPTEICSGKYPLHPTESAANICMKESVKCLLVFLKLLRFQQQTFSFFDLETNFVAFGTFQPKDQEIILRSLWFGCSICII